MPSPLLKWIMGKIGEASLKHDVSDLERLTKAAKRVQELEAKRAEADAELANLERALKTSPNSAKHQPERLDDYLADRNTLHITIDWRAAGVKRDPVVIHEKKASKALVRFLAEIQATLGDAALERLSSLKISRGPLVSRSPKVDFINHGNGSTYMHHQIGHTAFFVITHSGTTEKIDAINSAARMLELGEAVKVQRA
jgi:hypothetical protein